MYKITSRTIDGVGAQRGWKAREAAAKARMAAPIDDHVLENLRIAAERDQADRDAAAAVTAENECKRRETACPCPACDGGQKSLSVEEAAFVASALAYYRSKGFKTDPDQYATMNARAAKAAPLAPITETVSQVTVHANADLAAVADAVRQQVAPASEAAKPAKTQRKHVAPPFLDGDA